MDFLTRIFSGFAQIAGGLAELGLALWETAAAWALLILWIVWWLAAVDWRKMWPVLGRGGWAPLFLLVVLAALVWSRLDATERFAPVFWWHLAAVSALVLLAFVCGWLQGILQCAPPEISVNPPPTHHAHSHHHH